MIDDSITHVRPRMHNVLLVLVVLGAFIGILFVHVYFADKFKQEMDAVSKQVDSINWPPKS